MPISTLEFRLCFKYTLAAYPLRFDEQPYFGQTRPARSQYCIPPVAGFAVLHLMPNFWLMAPAVKDQLFLAEIS